MVDRRWLVCPMVIVLIGAGCMTGHRSGIVSDAAPLNATERDAIGRIALRMTPPPAAPAIAVHQGARTRSASATTGGALGGAARGASDVLNGLSDSDAPVVAYALLVPLAMATGAIAGALAANAADATPVAPVTGARTTPGGTDVSFDRLHAQLADDLAAMNVEALEHMASDEQLAQAGFASIVDVVLYRPMVSGKRRRSRFVQLHKVRVRSLTGAFDNRTWYREQISGYRPIDEWLAEDNRAIQSELLVLQVNVLRDLQQILGHRSAGSNAD